MLELGSWDTIVLAGLIVFFLFVEKYLSRGIKN
jgi:hypothetical protein